MPQASARIVTWLGLGLVALNGALLAHYASKATMLPRAIEGLLSRSYDLAVLGVFVTSALLSGSAIRQRVGIANDTPAYRLVTSAGLGFIGLYALGALLVVTQLVEVPWLWAAVVLPALACCGQAPTVFSDLRSLARLPAPGAVFVVGALLACLYALMALGPPSDIDAFAYHLAIPQQYLDNGGATHHADNFYRSFPPAMSLLYMFLMGLGSDCLPKLLHGLFLIMTALLCYDRFRRHAGSVVAGYAVLLFAAEWSVQHGIERANVDFHFTFYALASLLLVLDFVSERLVATRTLVGAGLLLGGAISSKPNALASAVAMELLIIVLLARKRVTLRSFFWFNVAAVAVYAPTLLRNVVYGLEPLFVPLADLLQPMLGLDAGEVARYRAVGEVKPLLMTRFTPATFLLTPLFAYSDGRFPNPNFDGFISPFYLVGLVVAGILLRRSPVVRGLYLYMLGYYVVWLATATVIRYAMPLLPLLSLCAVWAFHALAAQASPRGGRWIRRGVHTVVLAFAVLSAASCALARGPRLGLNLIAFAELIDRTSFLRAVHSDAVSIMAVDDYLRDPERARSDPSEAVFMVFEAQNLHLHRRFYNDPAYVNLLLLHAHQSDPRGAIGWLQDRGYRYVLTDFSRIGWLRNAQNDNPYLSPYPDGIRTLQNMLGFWESRLQPNLRFLERFGRLELYEVPSEPGTSP